MLHAGIPSPWPVVPGGMASHPHHPVVPMGGPPTDLLLHHQGGRGTQVTGGVVPGVLGGPEHHQVVHHPTPSYSLMGHLTTGNGGYPPLPGPPPPDNRYHLHHQPHQSPVVGPPSFYNGNYAASVGGGTAPPNGLGGPHSHIVRSLSRQSQEGNGIRHASGSSQTSSHSATPPSPDEPRGSLLYQQQNNLGNRMVGAGPGRRDSALSVSSPATSVAGQLNHEAGGTAIPSPAGTMNHTTSSPSATHHTAPLPPTSSMNVSSLAGVGGPGASPRPGGGTTSTYHSAVKQEPGSPATYPAQNNLSRTSIVKQEPKNPNSPGSFPGGPGGPGSGQRAQLGSPTTSPSVHAASSRYPLITTRPPSTFSYPSPQQPQAPSATNPIPPVTEFNRYQHNSGGGSKPSPGQESQCNSAISSREGTPGPTKVWGAEDLSGPAPNVDISRVQVKEELPGSLYETASNEYNQRPKVNLNYPAPTSLAPPIGTVPRTTVDSYMSPYHHALPPQVSVPARCTTAGPTLQPPASVVGSGSAIATAAAVAMAGVGGPPTSYRSNVGRPPIMGPGNSDGTGPMQVTAGSVSHSNVKIGRRPAHLPKVLKFEDHTLPHGWQRKLKQRKHGKQAGRWDVYIYSPCGVKFASRKKLKHFFEKNNLQYDAEQFDFTPYGKHIDNNASARHLSSASSGSNRHSGSPCGVSSPTSSGYPSGCTSNSSSDMMLPLGGPTGPGGGLPPTAHHPIAYMPPNHTQYGGFDPMMESPPNANARELPHNHVLNLSQNSLGRHPASRLGLHHRPPHGGGVGGPSFPLEMDNLLNENMGYGRTRDYVGGHDHGVGGEEEHEDSHRDDSGRGFMATSMNILSEGTMDMSMDVYTGMYSSH
jgi:hypothetical protein